MEDSSQPNFVERRMDGQTHGRTDTLAFYSRFYQRNALTLSVFELEKYFSFNRSKFCQKAIGTIIRNPQAQYKTEKSSLGFGVNHQNMALYRVSSKQAQNLCIGA